MNSSFWIEGIGYLGSALVVVSMLMSSVVRLRIINTTGSVIFAIYALIIRSYPTALMNFCLVAINVYHLWRLRNTEKHYALFEGSAGDGYLAYLLDYFREDIEKYFPDFTREKAKNPLNRVFSVCCDNEVAGILVGNVQAGEMDVLLDYSTPIYRDCSVGQYLYEKLPAFGIRRLLYRGKSTEHIAYLNKMGFTQASDGSYVMEFPSGGNRS